MAPSLSRASGEATSAKRREATARSRRTPSPYSSHGWREDRIHQVSPKTRRWADAMDGAVDRPMRLSPCLTPHERFAKSARACRAPWPASRRVRVAGRSRDDAAPVLKRSSWLRLHRWRIRIFRSCHRPSRFNQPSHGCKAPGRCLQLGHDLHQRTFGQPVWCPRRIRQRRSTCARGPHPAPGGAAHIVTIVALRVASTVSNRNFPTTTARCAHAAQVVALQVDQHHVLGAFLRIAASVANTLTRSCTSKRGRVPAIGRVSTVSPCNRHQTFRRGR